MRFLLFVLIFGNVSCCGSVHIPNFRNRTSESVPKCVTILLAPHVLYKYFGALTLPPFVWQNLSLQHSPLFLDVICMSPVMGLVMFRFIYRTLFVTVVRHTTILFPKIRLNDQIWPYVLLDDRQNCTLLSVLNHNRKPIFFLVYIPEYP